MPTLPRVDGGVRLEIVEHARRAPTPRAQRAPIVRLARLAFVRETDDSLRQSGAVVGLNGRRIQERESPAVEDELLRRRRVASRRRRRKGERGAVRAAVASDDPALGRDFRAGT